MAFDAFLTIDGVESESTRDGFEGQIEIISFSLGASNPTSMGSGGGAGQGKVSLTPIRFVKKTDKASPSLFQACCTGKHFATGTVVLHKAGGNSAVPYLKLEFEKLFIDSIDWSGAGKGDDTPMESVTAAFGKVTITYTPQDPDSGDPGGPVVASWDQLKVTK